MWGHHKGHSHKSMLTASYEKRRLFLQKLLHGMTKVLNVMPIAPRKGDSMAVREVKISANPSHFVNSLYRFSMVKRERKSFLIEYC